MLKKLKSLFIVDDEEFKKQMSGQQDKPKSAPAAPAEQPSSTSTVSTVSDGQVSDKFLKILFGALEKSNLDGFDYLEYKKSLRNLEKMDMDDATRYKSAFAMAQTMNATPQKLIQTAEHYLKALSEEETKFEQALANQRSKQIQGKEKKNQELDQMIRDKAEQIKKLSAEIESHQQQMEKQAKEIQKAANKVAQTKADFEASYQTIVGQIREDVEKMKQYLK